MTPEQVKQIADNELCGLVDDYTSHGVLDFARAIEARVLEELRKQAVDFSFEFPAHSLQREALQQLVTRLSIAAPIPPTPSADTWSGIMEVCRVRGTHGRSDYITTGNRMDNRCNLRVTFDGSELIEAEVARPPNTPDGMRMFAVIDMSAPIPPTPTPTPSQEEANREASLYRWWKKNREVTLITAIYGNGCVNKTLADVEAFILARPDTEGSGK